MLTLQVYAPRTRLAEVMAILADQPGVGHVVQIGSTSVGDLVLVTADVPVGDIDPLLPKLQACAVEGDDIAIIHRDSNRPLGKSGRGDLPSWTGGGLAWTELAMASRQYARAVPQYLAFMACAGVIAAFGVLTRNTILIVGAMAISPDLFPLCATCVGIVDRRPRRVGRAFAALVLGLGLAGLVAFAVTAVLRVAGYAAANGSLGDGGLGVLPRVSVATVVVAFVAGVAGMLAFESRSSSAVGVAISITTIPAAAFAGAAVAVHDLHGAQGALGVLGANIGMLLVAGTLTLLLQRLVRRRRT